MKLNQKFTMMKLQIIQTNFSLAAISPFYEIAISILLQDSNDLITVDKVSMLLMLCVDLYLKIFFLIMADRGRLFFICKLHSFLNRNCSCWTVRAIVVRLSNQFYQIQQPFTSHLSIKDPIDFLYRVVASNFLAFHSQKMSISWPSQLVY